MPPSFMSANNGAGLRIDGPPRGRRPLLERSAQTRYSNQITTAANKARPVPDVFLLPCPVVLYRVKHRYQGNQGLCQKTRCFYGEPSARRQP